MTQVTFNLTRAQLEAIRTKLEADGINVVGDSGDITYGRVVIGFTYTEPIFLATIKDSGPYPAFIVKDKLESWFKTEEANG